MPSCPEGALQIIDGKARVVRESYCDGLGACLGHCPQGALSVVEQEADAYDESAVIVHLEQNAPDMLEQHMAHLRAHAPELIQPQKPPVAGCPSMQIRLWDEPAQSKAETPRQKSELRQWPVQLHLLPPRAPFFQGANLTLIADCVPFACPNFHADYLRNTAVAMGCPKLDDARAYVEKVSQILEQSDIRSLKVVHMEVPCCQGLIRIAQAAMQISGKEIPFETVMVRINQES
jgi:Fe-S-cluster-containing hydrogenase component 2